MTTRFGPSLERLDHHFRQLLFGIGYPREKIEAFSKLMCPLWDSGSAKVEREMRVFLDGFSAVWDDYDRRLIELGACRDELADTIDDDEVRDEMRFAWDVGLPIGSAIYSVVTKRAYAEHRYEQVAEGSKARPYLRFRFHVNLIGPALDCQSLDCEIAGWDSETLPRLPCWRPDCACYFEALSPADLQKLKTTI